MKGFNYKKAVQALNFFALKEGGSINKLKVLKLIFFADRLHLRKYGRPIIGDKYFALEHGPVASGTKDLAENTPFQSKEESSYRNHYLRTVDPYTFSSINTLDEIVFSKSDLDALAAVYDKFGKLEKYQLRDITHEFPEWKKWEADLNSGHSRIEMSYEDFFLEEQKYGKEFNENEELVSLNKEMFLENCKIN